LHGNLDADAAQELDGLQDEVEPCGCRSQARGRRKSFAVHDYEGIRPVFNVNSRYVPLAVASVKLRGGIRSARARLAARGQNAANEDALEQFRDVYLGDWNGS